MAGFRHRRHRRIRVAGLLAGLAMILAGLATITAPVFWLGFIVAAGTQFGGQRWCQKRGRQLSGRGR
jgi:hypothetical protein